ncbi:MAG: phosphotransferase [Metamycoplasmataceae bacterium]
MKKIKSHTNKSFEINENGKKLFYQEFIFNGFNHKIDYSLLDKFSFVPKLINYQKEKGLITWEFIENQEYQKLNKAEIIELAKKVFEINNSLLYFPKFNLRERINNYRKILKEKRIEIPIIEKYFKKINMILSKMNKTTPIHGDIWTKNVLKTNNGLFIIDWEYAFLGDKHFELAYIILSFDFNEEEEELFLSNYGNYNSDFLENQKILVYYYIILWINAQKNKPFDDKGFIEKLEEKLY